MKKKTSNIAGKAMCASCGNHHFKWWMISPKKMSQKIGCASYVLCSAESKEYHIYGEYGSGYDMSIFKVVKPFIGYAKHIHAVDRLRKNLSTSVPVICDKCITRFLRKNYIIQMSSFDCR